MSRINFIKPLPPSREKELRIWYRIMLALLATIVPTIIIISSIQLYLWASLHSKKTALARELTSFNTVITQQQSDRTQQTQLKKQIDCMQRYSSDPKNPTRIVAAIIEATKESQLQSMAISKKAVEFQINSPSTDTVLTTMKRLADAQIDNVPLVHNVTLAALSSVQQQIHATIKAIPVRALHDGKYDRAAKS